MSGRPGHDRIERDEVADLVRTWHDSAVQVSRRDLIRLGAIVGGAVAAARTGVTIAAPDRTARLAPPRNADVEKDVTIAVPFDPYGVPVTLDPHRSPNWGPFWVMFPNVWNGLLAFDPNGKVVADLASDYTVSDDGKVYTFTIRDGAKYASGNEVKAGDFIASWKRALAPGAVSPMAGFMSRVSGYKKYVEGTSEEIGFAAPDDRTVVVTLAKSYSYFPSYMATFVWSVVDPAVLASAGDADFPLKDAGAGPWRFTEFDQTSRLVMEPNTNYYGGNSESIAKIEWPFVSGPQAAETALELYKADQAVSADVPMSLLDAVQGDDTLTDELQRIAPEGSVRCIQMDFKQAPFNDVRVRLAVAHAIDREAWANDIWKGAWTPATHVSPPVLKETCGYEAPDGPEFDPDKARNLLKAAGFENGEGLPEIICYQPSEDPDEDKARTQALLDMIKENSGIAITLDATRTGQQITSMQQENGGRQFEVTWWWNSFETPRMLNEVFAPGSEWMKGWFNWTEDLEPSGDFDPGPDSSAFDDLCDDADISLDPGERNDKYAQAEALLLKNAVAIPLGFWSQLYIQKPWLQGTRQGPMTGRLPVLFDKDVVVVKH